MSAKKFIVAKHEIKVLAIMLSRQLGITSVIRENSGVSNSEMQHSLQLLRVSAGAC